MNKKVWGVVLVAFLGLFLLGGCGQKQDLKETLTAGDGKWEVQTEEGSGKIVFFENGTCIQSDDRNEEKAEYKIGSNNKVTFIDPDTNKDLMYFSEITIKEKDKVLEGLYKRADSDEEALSVKYIKL